MIKLDGSQGEGGGQILRSALALSAITSEPFIMENIRAQRAKPGLKAQHVMSVQAVSDITQAEVEGAFKHSSRLKFSPKSIIPGKYTWDIQTAGSTSLVLQTIVYPLSLTDRPSSVTIIGGTHVPWSPCYHYLELQWNHYMKMMGLKVELEMHRAGFFPKGGGMISAQIAPATQMKSVNLIERGDLVTIQGISFAANLDQSIAERQQRRTKIRLGQYNLISNIRLVSVPAVGKNTMLFLLAHFQNSQCCYFSLGAIGKRAEKVADEAVDQLMQFLGTEGTVDQYLADQLVLPIALSRHTSIFKTSCITQHLLTNIDIIQKFLDVKIKAVGELNSEGIVEFF